MEIASRSASLHGPHGPLPIGLKEGLRAASQQTCNVSTTGQPHNVGEVIHEASLPYALFAETIHDMF
jgi:hypothetical protein